ncbi:MAG: SRPBCC domain-containing protein [Sphingomonadales bacterium]|jgi:uncharacterized protein YndB with AHSA1/START domain
MAADDTTKVERVSERELSITRLFAAPRPLVYRAWSEAALFRRWWVPASVPGMQLAGCEMDVRTGGQYRLEFAFGDATMAFHGRYLEVVPGERMVWTNDEDAAGAVTTVTFHDHDGQTLVRVHEQYPTAEALAEALDGSAAALPEQLDQLAAVLAADGQG